MTMQKFCLSLHYNGASSYIFVNGTEIIKFKAKNSEVNPIPLCIGKILEDLSVDDLKRTGFYGYVYYFSIDYYIAVGDTLDIDKYLMKRMIQY